MGFWCFYIWNSQINVGASTSGVEKSAFESAEDEGGKASKLDEVISIVPAAVDEEGAGIEEVETAESS